MPHDSGAAGVDSPADQLRLSLQQQWDAPPVAAAVVVLKAMGVDAGELDADGLRATLFFPTAADAGRYAGAIRALAPGGGRKELKGAEKKIAVALLTLLYLSHLRPSRSTAQSFAAAFVLADGLASLAGLLEHANLHIRAQAVETLKLLTAGSEDVGDDDDDGYELLDWFGDASRDPQRALNGKLAGLADDGSFIGGLLANRGKGASYPGGGFACMQLLAFWLSWVRQLRCASRKLPLSRRLLEGLSDWAAGGVAEHEGERQLARQVFDDFSRVGAYDGRGDVGLDDDDDGAAAAEVLELSEDGAFDLDAPPPPAPAKKTALVPHAPSTAPPPPPDAKAKAKAAKAAARAARPAKAAAAAIGSVMEAPTSARECGNDAFRRGASEEALSHYAEALAELDARDAAAPAASTTATATATAHGSDRAAIHCNRATCKLSLHDAALRDAVSAEGGADEPASRQAAAQAVSEAEAECRAALAADASYFKAHYRLAQVLRARGGTARRREAIDAAERALDLLDEEGTSVSVASASAARHAIEELLVDLMSAVRSGAKRGGGGGKQRVDKAASIMQQILRRKADGLDGDGGDDGAHEMLAKTDQPTKLDMLERRERERDQRPSRARDAARADGGAAAEDGSDSDDDDKMVPAPRKPKKSDGGAGGAKKEKGKDKDKGKDKGKSKEGKDKEKGAALAAAGGGGVRRGASATASLKSFRKLRLDAAALEQNCLRRGDAGADAGSAGGGKGGGDGWVELSRLFGEALAEDDVAAIVRVAARRCAAPLDDAAGAFALLRALSAVPRFRMVIGMVDDDVVATLRGVWAHLGRNPLCAESEATLVALAREFGCGDSCVVTLGDGLD